MNNRLWLCIASQTDVYLYLCSYRVRGVDGSCAKHLTVESCAFDAVGRQEGHPACKKRVVWGVSVVVCLERGADLHMAQLMPLLLTVSCSSKIQIGFTFLVPAYPGCPGKEAVKWLCSCSSYAANTHTHPFNGPFSGTAQVSRYQKGKTILDFADARQ